MKYEAAAARPPLTSMSKGVVIMLSPVNFACTKKENENRQQKISRLPKPRMNVNQIWQTLIAPRMMSIKAVRKMDKLKRMSL
jgi:hypothetical protein